MSLCVLAQCMLCPIAFIVANSKTKLELRILMCPLGTCSVHGAVVR